MWGKGKDLTYQELVAAVDEIGVASNNNPTFRASSVDGQYLSYTFEPGQEAQDVTANGRDLTNLHNVETQYDTLKLLGDESYVETPLAKLGFGNTLEFDVTLTQEAQPGQILFEADSEYDTHDIRILDDGTLGDTTELYDYSFGYTLPVGETVHLKVVSERENSALYVNGVRYDAVGRYSEEETGLNLTNIGYPSFVLPLQRIGSKTNAVVGLIDNVTVTVTPEVESKVESFSASSEYSGNPIANAFGGLYRDVYVTVTGPVYITDAIESETTAGGGVFLTSPSVSKESATVNAKTEVENTGSSDASVTMVTEIVDGDSVVASQEDTQTVGAGEKYSFSQNLTVSNPRLWSVDTPELYTVRSVLKQDGTVIGTVETTYGIRKVEWKRDGCYINDERVELVGTNLHSETYMLGNAQSNDSIFEDVKRLKEYSFNFIRMSHYPHDPAFYEACDRYGVAVLDCLAGWQNYSDSDAFKNNTYEQMRDQMRVNRNHCSVVAWEPSLNESSFTTAWAQNMHNLVKEEYPEVGDSKAYTSGWINWNVFDIGVGTPQANVVGDASKYSDKPVIVSEYGDWNFGGFDSTTRVTREPKHYSDAEGGDKGMLTQCDNIQSSFAFNRGQSWYGATAYWDYADYAGFDVDKLTFCGVVDVARIAKHGAYFFQSQTDPNLDMSKYGLDTGAMVYIANTWASDSPDQVRVYSNCDEVELYLDDQLIARQTPDTQMWAPHGDTDNPTGYPTADSGAYVSTENLAHPPFTFDLSGYTPGQGTLKAVAYLNGEAVETYIRQAPGTASQITLTGENDEALKPDGSTAKLVWVDVRDENGTVVNTANHTINFTTEGPGFVIGEKAVQVRGGQWAVWVRSTRGEGDITLKATCDGLTAATITIPTQTVEGLPEVPEGGDADETGFVHPEPPAAPVNICLNKTASASSININAQGEEKAEWANDGDTSTKWCAKNPSPSDAFGTHWWQVDLGRSYTVEEMEIIFDAAGDWKFHVAVSDDPNFEGYTIPDDGILTTSADRATVTVGQQGRYVRIYLNDHQQARGFPGS